MHQLLAAAGVEVVTLQENTIVLALARFSGNPCVLVGQDRLAPVPGPAAMRLARRGMRVAAELRLPLVTVIDTTGAELSQQAEEGGLAAELAATLAELVSLDVPTVSLLLGQGAGGAALALFPADRVLALQHGWLAALPPEGASAILYRDAGHAAELAARQRICAPDLAADGLVDTVIAEDPQQPALACERAAAELAWELGQVVADGDPAARLAGAGPLPQGRRRPRLNRHRGNQRPLACARRSGFPHIPNRAIGAIPAMPGSSAPISPQSAIRTNACRRVWWFRRGGDLA